MEDTAPTANTPLSQEEEAQIIDWDQRERDARAWMVEHLFEYEVEGWPGEIDTRELHQATLRSFASRGLWRSHVDLANEVVRNAGLVSHWDANQQRRQAEREAKTVYDDKLFAQAEKASSVMRLADGKPIKQFTHLGDWWVPVAGMNGTSYDCREIVPLHDYQGETYRREDRQPGVWRDYAGRIVEGRKHLGGQGNEWVFTDRWMIVALEKMRPAVVEVGAGGKPVEIVPAAQARDLGKKLKDFDRRDLREWYGGEKSSVALYRRLSAGDWLLFHNKEVVRTLTDQLEANTAFWTLFEETKRGAA